MYFVKVIALALLCYGVVNGEVTSDVSTDLASKSSEAADVNATTVSQQLQEEPSEIVKVVVAKNETTSTTNPPLPNPNAVQQEHNNSMAIFFVLCVIALGTSSVV